MGKIWKTLNKKIGFISLDESKGGPAYFEGASIFIIFIFLFEIILAIIGKGNKKDNLKKLFKTKFKIFTKVFLLLFGGVALGIGIFIFIGWLLSDV